MTTLLISDLHLDDARPEATGWLHTLLRGPARSADALYILGDLFDFWIGDDVISQTARAAAAELEALAASGVPCHFQHGNRDFLVGRDYAERAGLRVLGEQVVLDLYGTPTLLLHGDTLCTDDVEYQAFRRQVRAPAFQAMFLAKSAEQRFELAQQARDASQRHTGKTAMAIMDVNDAAVRDAFLAHGVERMIHGHTHRPAVHRHPLGGERVGERFVLADWYDSGSYLEVGPDGCRAVSLKR